MRKAIAVSSLLILFFLSSCNFPLKYPGNPADEIPFPTDSDEDADTIPLSTATPQPFLEVDGVFHYPAQSGDTLTVVARHFGVTVGEITSEEQIDPTDIITPGQVLLIPNVLGGSFNSANLLPDSEVIYSPTAADFNIVGFVNEKGGYLSTFRQKVGDEELSGAEIVQRIAYSTSVNPRLLLALIEFRSHWLTETPEEINITYPLGFYYKDHQGFYLECAMAAKWINAGYYGWREGLMTEYTFIDGKSMRVEPQLNAGTMALQYLFSQFSYSYDWQVQLYGPNSLPDLFISLFGNPWERAAAVEPLFSPGVEMPVLELPFAVGQEWALTGGLHYDWNAGTPMGALDFAPITGETPCSVSRAWVLAPANGRIVFSQGNMVILDVYDEGQKSTGWQVVFMHIAAQGSIAAGTLVSKDDYVGHPSCEGGQATGTHVHIARRYKGEWIGAGEPFPFVLGGWTAIPGSVQFQSSLVKGDQVVTSDINGSEKSRITRKGDF